MKVTRKKDKFLYVSLFSNIVIKLFNLETETKIKILFLQNLHNIYLILLIITKVIDI